MNKYLNVELANMHLSYGAAGSKECACTSKVFCTGALLIMLSLHVCTEAYVRATMNREGTIRTPDNEENVLNPAEGNLSMSARAIGQ
ncbi:hypothetical protein AVEN_119460-1 [Araneus ventricosus]|uniref:Uncharacterized protein n=1 Tax=Araneus ventricosus TaxID=182803 RepID=A0A4Y2DKS1_ARAVE|nr:hypothetical protein AVEN_119460-1 [Araneus ventricosus]